MKKGWFILLCALIPISVIAYGCILLYLTWPVDVASIANAGVFGDSFGVLTSFFSALAFLGVVLTLSYQREEFKLQKMELQENRKEIEKQGFENSFFQMLKLHNDILNSLSRQRRVNGNNVNYEGRVVIKQMHEYLISLLRERAMYRDMNLNELQNAYAEFYHREGYLLAHYFRFLYNIFKFISESKIENKILYARLARAQISNHELCIIYYNALSERGSKFEKYITEFKLMDNLHPTELFSIEHQYLIPGAGFRSEM